MIFQPIGSHAKHKPIQIMGWRRIENIVKFRENTEENMTNTFNPNIVHTSQKLEPRIRLETSKMEA